MSELTFKGNTVSKFGTYLPAPYIERVELLDDRVTTYISLFFVSSGDDTVDDSIIEHLNSKVNVYCMHAWRGASDVELSDFGYSESDWQSVVNGKVNIFKALYDARNQALIAAFNAAQQTSISVDMDGEDTVWAKAEDIYSEEGQQIIRYQTSVDYLFNTTDSATFGTPINPLTISDAAPEFWYTFAYTSTYTYSEYTIEDQLENIKLLANKTSDVSYEKVFSEGKIRRLYTQYFDAEDVIYDDIPLESLGGFYYTNSGITHDQVKTYFEGLVTEFRALADTMEDSDELSDLENMLDNISSVLSGYGDTATLLVQLNYLRDLFTSKSNGDIVGKLYLRFRKRIYSTNEAIESGTLLQSRITRNPKIVDNKSSEVTEGYATASYSDDWESNHQNYLYDNAYYSLNTYLDDDDDNVYYNKGYFFFDYEKAYRETSELSQLINVNKLYQLWGLGPVYEKFRVHHAKLTRTAKTDSAYYTTLSTTLHTNTKYAKSQYYSWLGVPGATVTAGNAENSYVALRNFLPVEELPWAFGSEEIDNYHLMCFEFQDEFGSYDPDEYNEYEIQVAIEDNSVEVLEEIAAQYDGIITELEEYVNSSKEDCAHDQETGDFKPFFIDAMDNLYGANLEASPWYRAAVMYNLHRDLLLNTFDGDMDALIENVEEIVDTIGPYTGNRFVLETFQTNFETLYDSLYVNSIPGYLGMKSLEDDSGGADESEDDSGTPSDDPFSDGYSGGSSSSDSDDSADESSDDSGTPSDDPFSEGFSIAPLVFDDEAMETADEDAEDPTEEGLTDEDLEAADSSSDDESEMLTFTNNYTIANTSEAAAAMPPGDLAYYMSYRADWTTTSGFTTVEWNEWVDQVEGFQTTISDNASSFVASALYSWMASLMEEALDGGSWAQIMANYATIFSGGLGESVAAADALGIELEELSSTVFDEASHHDTDLWLALTGWLRYMWGAIKNDEVLEPSDVSSGYST